MNASPVPDLTTVLISSMPKLCAKFPNMAKIVKPAIRLVNVSSVVTIIASLSNKRMKSWISFTLSEWHDCGVMVYEKEKGFFGNKIDFTEFTKVRDYWRRKNIFLKKKVCMAIHYEMSHVLCITNRSFLPINIMTKFIMRWEHYDRSHTNRERKK